MSRRQITVLCILCSMILAIFSLKMISSYRAQASTNVDANAVKSKNVPINLASHTDPTGTANFQNLNIDPEQIASASDAPTPPPSAIDATERAIQNRLQELAALELKKARGGVEDGKTKAPTDSFPAAEEPKPSPSH